MLLFLKYLNDLGLNITCRHASGDELEPKPYILCNQIAITAIDLQKLYNAFSISYKIL